MRFVSFAALLASSLCALPSSMVDASMTIWNQCAGQNVYHSSGNLVPVECLNGRTCNNYESAPTGFNFFVSTSFAGTVGCNSLAEITPANGQWWYDISRIKGFNFAVDMWYNNNDAYCTNPDCANNEAYMMCATGQVDPQGAVRVEGQGGLFVITFCPNGNTNNFGRCCNNLELDGPHSNATSPVSSNAPAIVGYETLHFVNSRSADIASYTTTNAHTCASLCNDNANCASFVVDVAQTKCVLKGEVDNSAFVEDSSSHVFYKTAALSSPSSSPSSSPVLSTVMIAVAAAAGVLVMMTVVGVVMTMKKRRQQAKIDASNEAAAPMMTQAYSQL